MPGIATLAELAAFVATAIAVVAAVPQLRRVVIAGDGRGVSLCSALFGVVNESVWVLYTQHRDLWSALPEAVLMATSNAILLVWLLRAGAGGAGRAAGAAALWAAMLGTVAAVGGADALALALGAAYAVQVVPAVWTAWRTPSPSGVAATTWAMVLVESVLWGVYGLHHGDPATATMGVVGTLASLAIVVRKESVRQRQASTSLIVTTSLT